MKTEIKCPFCNPDISITSFSESQNFWAIYDIAPILPGHSLIIPKRHIKSIQELSTEQFDEFFQFGREVTKKLSLFFKTDAFDWIIQENEEAGQSIPHLHLHIILRTKDDLPNAGDWYSVLKNKNKEEVVDSENRPRFSIDELTNIAKKLKDAFVELDKEKSNT
ncbi:MAG: HIT family protein [Bacteroidetes bacterium]|nr:HIT family protein [Bacteroidota bacterium]